LFVPDHPVTKAKLDDVVAAEARVDVAAIVDACVAGVENVVCSA